MLNHIVVTEPLSDHMRASIGWRSRCRMEDARNLMHYLRWTADNRILLGGGDVGPLYGRRGTEARGHTSQAVLAHLEGYLLQLFPQLEDVQFTHGWSGRLSIAADMAPVVSRLGRHGHATGRRPAGRDS